LGQAVPRLAFRKQRCAFVIEAVESRLLYSQTIYVDANSSSSPRDGSSWPTAYRDLQLALSAAVAGDEIHVADGTYKPATSSRTTSFALKSGVKIYGGYAGDGAADPNFRDPATLVSTLSGNVGSSGAADNSYHVVTASGADANALLDGFTITAGNANSLSSPDYLGGGFYAIGGSPGISNCIFTGNASAGTGSGNGGGGAMYLASSSAPAISNCTFNANSTTSASPGGAVYLSIAYPSFTDCTFSNNSAAGNGGAVASVSGAFPSFPGCTFTNNTSSGAFGGGAIYSDSVLGSPLPILNCTFSSNRAQGSTSYGGAIYLNLGNLTGCTFNNNRANGSTGGGAILANGLTLNSCSFAENSTGSVGGAIYAGATSATNCSFSGNFALSAGALYHTTGSSSYSNCTFSNNLASSNNSGSGGGAAKSVGGSLTFTDCAFVLNRTNGTGGALYSTVPSAGSNVLTLTRCTFASNVAENGGGAAVTERFRLLAVNCLFTANVSRTGVGGGLQNNALLANSKITSCTFASNTGGGIVQSGSSAPISNCVVWGNFSGQVSGGTVTYSDVQGGFAGAGNIDADPSFTTPPSAGTDGNWGTSDDDPGDLRLQFYSPCIDAGDNTAVPVDAVTDLAGNARKFDFPGVHDPGAIVDMGAYELGMHLGILRVAAGQSVALPAGHFTFIVEQLAMATGATLDLKDNSLVIDYDASGPNPAAEIESLIVSAYHGGDWLGAGITSSTAANDSNYHLAVADNAAQPQPFGTAQGGPLFAGVDVDDTCVLVKFTHRVDLNLDGLVTDSDAITFSTYYEPGASAYWSIGDLNMDGLFSDDDAILFSTYFDSNLPPV
jgi:predicted outer membrane repeat protein